MIPKIVHQIWLSDEIPPQVQEWINTWDNIPGFEHKLWREDVYDLFGGKELFLSYYGLKDAHPALVSDLLRVRLIEKFGGFYVDCDCAYLDGLDGLCSMQFVTNIVGFQASSPVTYNEFFGAEPNHRFTYKLLDKFERNRQTAKSVLQKYGYTVFSETVIFEIDTDMAFINATKAQTIFKHFMMHSWLKEN